MARTIANPTTALKCRRLHQEVIWRVRSKCLSVEQRKTLLEIKKHISETIEATQMGMTFMVTAHIARQQILNDTGGTASKFLRMLLDSMDAIYGQMVNSQIACHYYKALDESIVEIPLIEENQPTSYQVPIIT
jgi:hypothetical protein